MDLNVVTFSGRLGADPVMRYTPSNTAVTNLRLAVKVAKESTLWFDVTVWGKQAETVNQYMKKGARVGVSGRLTEREWEDSTGTRRTSLVINANTVNFLDSKGDSDNSAGSDGVDESMVNIDSSKDEDSYSGDFPI